MSKFNLDLLKYLCLLLWHLQQIELSGGVLCKCVAKTFAMFEETKSYFDTYLTYFSDNYYYDLRMHAVTKA